MTAKLAVTITAYAMVPEDDYELRIGEIVSEFERGLQQADAVYAGPVVKQGIPSEIADTIPEGI